MDLALWAASATASADAESRRVLLGSSPEELAAGYAAGTLPAILQKEVTQFLGTYGFRCIGEIDIGVPRWSEDPTHILGSIANYARLDDTALNPDAKFEESAREAEAMIEELLGRVKGPRRLAARFALSRVRELIGLRETPKYNLIRLIATPARELLKPVGEQLAEAGRIPDPDAIFFLTIPDARRALAGEDLNGVVNVRREEFARERTRRHIPRVLLSNGTDAESLLAARPDSGTLVGSPASPGTLRGRARVILSPEGARIEPGEILVAPSTNPGWTPLFLTAGGLVMEMGGAMSHGAVVAREYGIPAVVGVPGATERIKSGTSIVVDGSAGTVQLEAEAPQ
jgi:pyruvate,water dikinase